MPSDKPDSMPFASAAMTRGALLHAVMASLALAGCSDRMCFQWSESEGACPPPEDADRFIAPNCEEKVTFDLDQEGDFEGDVCCYDVDKEDDESGFCGEF